MPATTIRQPTLDDLEQATSRAAERGRSLGKIVTWTVDKHVVIPVARLREVLEAAGLPATTLPLPDVREGRVLARALRNLGEAGLVEVVTQTTDRVVYQLTERARERERDRLEYHQRYKIAWYKGEEGVPDYLRFLQRTSEPIIFMGQDGEPVPWEVEEQLRDLIARYRTVYLPRDITTYVLLAAVMRNGAIQMNDRGHPYFVPEYGVGVLDQLRSVLAAITEATSYPCKIRSFTVADTPDDRDEIGLAALDDLMRDLEMLDYDLGEREAEADAVRVTTMERFEEKLNEVMTKVTAYLAIGDLRGVRFEALESRAEAIRKRALDLKRKAEERPEAAPKRRGRRATVSAEGVEVEITARRGRRLNLDELADDAGAIAGQDTPGEGRQGRAARAL